MPKQNLLVELYSNLKTTGALSFSSRALVHKMVSQVDFQEARLLIEFGGGDGSITRGIINRMHPDAELLVFEINSSFCKEMEKEFDQANVRIINASASQLPTYIGDQKVDFIFSSLPFSILSKEVCTEIFSVSKKSLKSGGAWIQISYSYFMKQRLKKYFEQVSVSGTLKNFPPAFVMLCKN